MVSLIILGEFNSSSMLNIAPPSSSVAVFANTPTGLSEHARLAVLEVLDQFPGGLVIDHLRLHYRGASFVALEPHQNIPHCFILGCGAIKRIRDTHAIEMRKRDAFAVFLGVRSESKHAPIRAVFLPDISVHTPSESDVPIIGLRAAANINLFDHNIADEEGVSFVYRFKPGSRRRVPAIGWLLPAPISLRKQVTQSGRGKLSMTALSQSLNLS